MGWLRIGNNDLGVLLLGIGALYLISRKKGGSSGGFYSHNYQWIPFTARGGYYIEDKSTGDQVEVAYGSLAKSYRKHPEIVHEAFQATTSKSRKGGITLHSTPKNSMGYVIR